MFNLHKLDDLKEVLMTGNQLIIAFDSLLRLLKFRQLNLNEF
jgi:hypothetical protein